MESRRRDGNAMYLLKNNYVSGTTEITAKLRDQLSCVSHIVTARCGAHLEFRSISLGPGAFTLWAADRPARTYLIPISLHVMC